MDQMLELQKLFYGSTSEVNFTLLVFHFFLTIVMSFVIKAFYTKYSLALNEKLDIANVIPILAAVIFLVIVVVKSSLALSIGLIGALSIVRFRTPIKEPEELVYLFLTIALGLGYGAGYALITTIIILFTLGVIYFLLSNKKVERLSKYNLVVKWSNSEISYDQIADSVIYICSNSKLLRFNKMGDSSSAEFEISSRKSIKINTISQEMHNVDPNINFTLTSAKTNSRIKY